MVAISVRAPMENGTRGRVANMRTPPLFGAGWSALWEAAVEVLRVPMYILPPPSAIFVQFAQKFPRIWEYTLVTGQETLVGFAAAILLGVPMGLLVAFSPLLRRTFYPLAVTLEMVPKIVFAPVFISWWGLGFTPKIYVFVLVCFFPIMLKGFLAFTSPPAAAAARPAASSARAGAPPCASASWRPCRRLCRSCSSVSRVRRSMPR